MFGFGMVPGEFRQLPEYRGLPEPPGSQWALMRQSGKEEEEAKVGAPPKPNPNWEGGRPCYLLCTALDFPEEERMMQ